MIATGRTYANDLRDLTRILRHVIDARLDNRNSYDKNRLRQAAKGIPSGFALKIRAAKSRNVENITMCGTMLRQARETLRGQQSVFERARTGYVR